MVKFIENDDFGYWQAIIRKVSLFEILAVLSMEVLIRHIDNLKDWICGQP